MKIPKPPASLVDHFDALLARTSGERRTLSGCPSGFAGGDRR